MIVSRIAGGLPAASFALLLLVGAAPAAAGSAMGKVPWWAAGPMPAAMPAGGAQVLIPPPFVADPWDAWRAAQAYRWRPMEAPSRRAPMRAAWRPPVPSTAMPVRPVQVWGPMPARVAAWRAPTPTIVTVDGTPYRFRPVAPWSGRAVAQVGRWGGPVGHPGHAPFRPPQPSQVAPWRGPSTLAFAPAPSRHWAQPPAPAQAWHGYRFRPDARFAMRGPPPGAPDSWYGPLPGADSGVRSPGSDFRAAPAQLVEPPTLWGRTVAYRYE